MSDEELENMLGAKIEVDERRNLVESDDEHFRNLQTAVDWRNN